MLTYEQSAALMNDPVFVDRIKVALLKYADFISNEATGTTAHNTRLRWAQQTMQAPNNMAQSYAPPVVMDTAVQTQGSAISDTDLQSAVETTVNKML
jgi:hypothetical protein